MALPSGPGGTSGTLSSGVGVSTGAGYRYPRDARYSAKTHYTRFDFYDYKPAFATAPGLGLTPSTSTADVANYNASVTQLTPASGFQSIYLYMPEDVSSDYGASWGGRSFSNIGAGILKTIGPTLGNADVGASALNLINQVKEKAEGFGPGIAAAGLATALNTIPGAGGGVTIDDVLAGSRGVVVNPNAELMFQNAEMRTFSLSFKMVPRNATEANEIQKILYQFKKASLPTFGGQGILGATSDNFIGVPKIVDVNFMIGGDINQYVSQYKPCAITNVKINYTPDGTYAVYEGGQPVAIGLDISFSELKLVFADEIRSDTWSY